AERRILPLSCCSSSFPLLQLTSHLLLYCSIVKSATNPSLSLSPLLHSFNQIFDEVDDEDEEDQQ
ncbi:hypothetical protein HID58_018720, partial [Brassica napus]